MPERIQYTQECKSDDHTKLSEQDLVAKALFNRDDLLAYEFQRRQAKIKERSAFTAYIPKVDFGLKKAYVVPTQLIHPETAEPKLCPDETSLTDVTFAASQLIFSGLRPLLDYRIAKEGTRIVELQEQTAANQIRFSTESAFLQMQRLHWQKEYIESLNKAAKTNLSLSSCQNMVGFLSPPVWQTAIADYGAAQSDVFNYDKQKIQAFETLQRQVSAPISPDDIDYCPDTMEPIFLKSLDFYVRAAMRYRPELEQQKRFAKQARWQERRYSRNYIPEVRVYAEAFDNQLKVWGPRYRLARWAAGLRLDWSFDGLVSVHAAEEQRNLAVQYQLREKDLELSIETDVKTTYEQIEILQNKLKAELLKLKQQKTDLLAKENQFEIGSIAKADLDNAKLGYKATEFNVISLQIEVKLQYQNLLFICGYPRNIGARYEVGT